jgi:hypothetical protein
MKFIVGKVIRGVNADCEPARLETWRREKGAVGDALPALPLFLWSDRYINVDLEQTYQNAREVYPGPLKLLFPSERLLRKDRPFSVRVNAPGWRLFSANAKRGELRLLPFFLASFVEIFLLFLG